MYTTNHNKFLIFYWGNMMKTTIDWIYPCPQSEPLNQNERDNINYDNYHLYFDDNYPLYFDYDSIGIRENVTIPDIPWNAWHPSLNDDDAYINFNEQDYIALQEHNFGEIFVDLHFCSNIAGLFDENGAFSYFHEADRLVSNYTLFSRYLNYSLKLIGLTNAYLKSDDGTFHDYNNTLYEKVGDFIYNYSIIWGMPNIPNSIEELEYSFTSISNELDLVSAKKIMEHLIELIKSDNRKTYPIDEIDNLVDSLGEDCSKRRILLKLAAIQQENNYRDIQHLSLQNEAFRTYIQISIEPYITNTISNDTRKYLSYNARIPRFENEDIKQLNKILNKARKLIKYVDKTSKETNNLLEPYWNNNPSKCFGFMNIEGNKYFNLSGVWDAQEDKLIKYFHFNSDTINKRKLLDKLMDILPSFYSNTPTHYAYCNLKVLSSNVSYKETTLKDALNLSLTENQISKHYSCCERKMLSFVDRNPSHQKNGFILIRKKPCDDCWNIIQKYKLHYNLAVYYINKKNQLKSM